MPSKLLIVIVSAALTLPASAAFPADDFALTPLSDKNTNILVLSPEIGAHTNCVQGIGSTIECSSYRVAPDPQNCPSGENLITIRKFGYVSHVCSKG
jgi:hypothetical protein